MKQLLVLVSAIVAFGCESNPPPAAQPTTTTAVPSSAPRAPAPPAASAAPQSVATPGATTFTWDENKVSLSGKFVKKTVQGAFGDVQMLVLDAPITVRATRDFSECKASEIMLAGKFAPELVGTRVTIKGLLQPAQTGHHHTCPWLEGGEVTSEK